MSLEVESGNAEAREVSGAVRVAGFPSCEGWRGRLQRGVMRLITALSFLSLSWWMAGCAEWADHGPISPKMQGQMEALTVTKGDFLKRMEGKRPTPARPVILPFRLISGVPVLQASLNENGFTPMMIDTGASRSLIHASMAVEKKVPVLRAEDATVEMQGVVGKEQGRIGLLGSLRLGTWSLRGYPCLVRTYENRVARARGASSFPDSLLGFDVAQRNCSYLTLDYPAKHVTFGFQQSFTRRATGRSASAPFEVRQGVPFITLKSGGKSWEAIVDSGSFNGIEISQKVAEQLGVQDKGEPVKGLYLMAVGGTVTSGQANMRVVKLPEVSLLGDTYRDAEVDIAPGPSRVGSYFLKDYRVTFDFRRKRLWLEW